MKVLLFALTIAATATASHAQTSTATASAPAPVAPVAPVVVRQNSVIYSADGHLIGRVDHVRLIGGVPSTAGVIYSGSFIEIPISTLTANGRKLVTSLTGAQLRR